MIWKLWNDKAYVSNSLEPSNNIFVLKKCISMMIKALVFVTKSLYFLFEMGDVLPFYSEMAKGLPFQITFSFFLHGSYEIVRILWEKATFNANLGLKKAKF